MLSIIFTPPNIETAIATAPCFLKFLNQTSTLTHSSNPVHQMRNLIYVPSLTLKCSVCILDFEWHVWNKTGCNTNNSRCDTGLIEGNITVNYKCHLRLMRE